jgi:hypothetical protein
LSNVYLFKDELNPLDDDQKRIFLDYLYKSLQNKKIIFWSGEGYFNENQDGTDDLDYYINKDQITIEPDEINNYPLIFISHWKKGSLEYIEVSSVNESLNWREVISKVFAVSLASAFGQNMNSYFIRQRFAYIGPRLDGVYYVSGWRISPATPYTGTEILTESAIYLDMDVSGINQSYANAKSQKLGKEIISLLSVFLNKGFYKIPSEKRWVYLSEDESNVYQLGFHDFEPYPAVMPKKDPEKAGTFVDPENIVRPHFGQSFCLPNNIRKLFKTYNNLDPENKEAYLNAARMYQISLSLGRNNTTVLLSYQIAALDALSKPTRENNRNKNAIIGIVQKYSPGFEELIGNLYESIRSAHFHQGYFVEKDTEGINIKPFMGPIFKDYQQIFYNDVTRTVLISWLSERIIDSQ